MTPHPGNQNVTMNGNLTGPRLPFGNPIFMGNQSLFGNQTFLGNLAMSNLTGLAGILDGTKFNRTGPLVASGQGGTSNSSEGDINQQPTTAAATTTALPPAGGPPKFQF